MSTQDRVLEAQPLKTLEGANVVLELFTDRVLIRRTDPLAIFAPDMFDAVRTVDLNDISAVYLLDSKYSYSHWLMMILQLTNHKHISLLYNRKDHAQGVAIKAMIDAVISRRQPSPPATV